MCYGSTTKVSTLCQVSLALRNTMNGICWCPIRSLVRIGPFAFYRLDPKHAAHAIRAPGTFLLISHINTPIPAYFQTPHFSWALYSPFRVSPYVKRAQCLHCHCRAPFHHHLPHLIPSHTKSSLSSLHSGPGDQGSRTSSSKGCRVMALRDTA